jgi:hypothetical protein
MKKYSFCSEHSDFTGSVLEVKSHQVVLFSCHPAQKKPIRALSPALESGPTHSQ